MSKVIKFRAWDENLKMMDNDFFIHAGGTLFEKASTSYDTPNTEIEQTYALTLMQFTGLHDINGVEIYEGDIVTAQCYPFYSDGELNYVAEIQYMDDAAYLGWYYDLHVISDRVRGCACGSGLPDIARKELRVIGNIYQNPDLLK